MGRRSRDLPKAARNRPPSAAVWLSQIDGGVASERLRGEPQAAKTLEAKDLVFLDETWATTNMTRRVGRAPRGKRLVAAAPHGHWKTTTFVAALGVERLFAPMVIDGAMNGDLFVAYIEQILVPALRVGQVVVMDNLSCHKRVGVREAIEGAGCRLLYLPPYSPDLNPIEQAFAKLKSHLRKHEERTQAGLERFLGECLDRVPQLSATLRISRYTNLKAALVFVW